MGNEYKFFNRKKEEEELKKILHSDSNLIHFVYGPINTGKTALLTKVLKDIPDNYRVFYINFRGFENRKYDDFVRTLFTPRSDTIMDKVKDKLDIVDATLDWISGVWQKYNIGIELPSSIIKGFLKNNNESNSKDAFNYLELLFMKMNEKGMKPVLALDELQMLKELKRNGYVLHDLFNFMVRITKETHIAHCFAATSDSLFIEEIYGNARLKGRCKNFFVDDLEKKEAFEIYENFGFKDKELAWNYIGGKLGDMIRLEHERIFDKSEKNGAELMLRDEINSLENLLDKIHNKLLPKEIIEDIKMNEVLDCLKLISENDHIPKTKIKHKIRTLLIEENFLFLDPVTGMVKPQGQLIRKAMSNVKYEI